MRLGVTTPLGMTNCTKIEPMFADAGLDLSHAQDTQNMLCEFDKYDRAREGQRLKRRYS